MAGEAGGVVVRLLLLDSATDQLVVGIAEVELEARTGTLLGSADGVARRRANVELLPRALDLLGSLGFVPDDIDGVVCGRGPGSFTGVRIGVATAKGIAYGLGVPLWGASTLDAVAYSLARAGVTGEVAVVGDAMRQEIYPARYTIDPTGRVIRLTSDMVEKPEVTIERWAREGAALTIAGDGLAKYAGSFEEHIGDLLDVTGADLWVPTAQGLLDAFLTASDISSRPHAGVLLPVYTRLSDAEEAERLRGGLDLGRTTVPDSGVAGSLDDFAHDAATPRAPAFRVRPMTRGLAEVIFDPASGIQQTPGVSWSADGVIEELGRIDRLWLAAVRDGRPIGYIGARFITDEVQVLSISVHEDERRSGVASALMERLLADPRSRTSSLFTLEVAIDNHDAIAFYEASGFKSDGVRPGYYPGGIDAALLSRTLPYHGAPRVLAIESSCDETAAAVLVRREFARSPLVESDVIASQIDFHARFGGVVPEIASRKHTEAIVGVVDEALMRAGVSLAHTDAIAVTQGPGLVGALVIGLAYAKGLSFATGLPLIGVNHLEGHIAANTFSGVDLEFPAVALVVSGGHTSLVELAGPGRYRTLGETLDDATGEAFDKVAKVLGIGYPGGPALSKLAETGDPAAIDFPRAMLHSKDLRFSLSGLKTAVINHIHAEREADREIDLPDLAASFQQAIVDVQVAKSVDAVEQVGAKSFLLAGGVAANVRLRQALTDALSSRGVSVSVPALDLCTDNAVMIGVVGIDAYEFERFIGLSADALPGLRIDTE